MMSFFNFNPENSENFVFGTKDASFSRKCLINILRNTLSCNLTSYCSLMPSCRDSCVAVSEEDELLLLLPLLLLLDAITLTIP